jgi:hypothetical protein
MEEFDDKTSLLSAALVTAALLTTPAVARQGKSTSSGLDRNARMAAISHRTNGQTFISRAGDLPTRVERNVWDTGASTTGRWLAFLEQKSLDVRGMVTVPLHCRSHFFTARISCRT